MITMENLIKKQNERMNQLDLSITSGSLSDEDATLIIEIVLDTLIEVGNGTTDDELHKAADYLIALRDKWFDKRKIKMNTEEIKHQFEDFRDFVVNTGEWTPAMSENAFILAVKHILSFQEKEKKLPTDEEIEAHYRYHYQRSLYEEGARWMRDQLKN